MKYIAKRASMWRSDKSRPVEEAKQILIPCENGKEKVWVVEIFSLILIIPMNSKLVTDTRAI